MTEPDCPDSAALSKASAPMSTCSHCGFPLRTSSGLRHYGTHTAHQESECLRLLHAEIAQLKDAVRSARADEAHCWANRVDALTAQLREVDARYMALLKAVADGAFMQPRTVLLHLGPERPTPDDEAQPVRAEPLKARSTTTTRSG
jgi:hypothetical protein